MSYARAGAVCAGLAIMPAAAAQYLLIPESSTDQVYAFDATDGTLLNSSFIDIATQAAAAGVSSTPIEVLEVGNELWISDQVADRIWRYDTGGTFIGDIGVGDLNNIRGMEYVGDTVYVAQGSASGTLGEGIVTIDVPSLAVTGVFNGRPDADTSYWDVFFYNNELLVSNSDTGNDGIERYALDGTFLGFFASSDGVSDFDFIQQLAERSSNGNLLGGGFTPPSGVYEFQSDGTPLGTVAGVGFGPRGVHELDNGDVLWTNGTWTRTDSDIKFEGASFRFITESSVPAPGSAALLALAMTAAARRRRS